MSQISISQAARMAGISRQHLYKSYINPGKISVCKDNGKIYIDLSELLRVFPNCKLEATDDLHMLQDDSVNNLQENTELVNMLKSQLIEAKEREEWLKQQIDELRRQQSNLLEDKTIKERKKFLGIF